MVHVDPDRRTSALCDRSGFRSLECAWSRSGDRDELFGVKREDEHPAVDRLHPLHWTDAGFGII
jgi:hypothetical protein